jgi:hypothetical protein
MINVKKVTVTLCVGLLFSTSAMYAQSATNAVVQAKQVNGAKLLADTYTYMGNLDKFSFNADVTNTNIEDSLKIIEKRTSDVKVNRENQFRIDTKGTYIDRTVYLDKGVFTMMDNKEKYYASVKSGTNIDQTLVNIRKKLGIVLPLTTLIHSDMNKFVKPKKVQYFGTRNLNGVECNYIAFKMRKTTIHMWIENSNTPVIRYAKIVTPSKGTTDMALKWDTTPSFKDSVFKFKAPKNASNISIVPEK